MFAPNSNFRDHGLSGYERLFQHCHSRNRVIVEATAAYIYSRTALAELPKLPTRPQFIVVLREPVAQLRSLFHYFQQNWGWISADMTFRDFVEAQERDPVAFSSNELVANALQNVWYPEHLQKWRSGVGAERLTVILFEDLIRESPSTMRALARKMGIDEHFYDSYAYPVENPTYVVRSIVFQRFNIWIRRRFPRGLAYRAIRRAYRFLNTRRPTEEDFDSEVEQQLKQTFAPMLDELESEFGLDLSAWRKTASPPDQTSPEKAQGVPSRAQRSSNASIAEELRP